MTVAPEILDGLSPATRSVPWWRKPVLAPMLARREAAVGFTLVAVLQIGAGLRHANGLVCPMLFSTGVPCPGCGASRACAALIRGNLHEALHLHALAPLFLLVAALFTVSGVLPGVSRRRVAGFVAQIERRTGIGAVVLAVMVLYWAFRLMSAPHQFISLMKM